MMKFLRPIVETITEINRLEDKCHIIMIHGVGKIHNVTLDTYEWKFRMELDDGTYIRCTAPKREEPFSSSYFLEQDIIEFFGRV